MNVNSRVDKFKTSLILAIHKKLRRLGTLTFQEDDNSYINAVCYNGFIGEYYLELVKVASISMDGYDGYSEVIVEIIHENGDTIVTPLHDFSLNEIIEIAKLI